MITKKNNDTGPILKHRHAPLPATMIHEMDISKKQAERVRWIIKEASREELLDFNLFPYTVISFDNNIHDDMILCLLAINETVNGEGIKVHSSNAKENNLNLHHIVTKDPNQRSIGFNSDYKHFYLRSENEITIDVIKEKNNIPFTIQNYVIKDNEESVDMDQDAIDAFVELGHLQRHKPEKAMFNYQMKIGGGCMSMALEHAGDIIHRVTHHTKYNSLYRGYAEDKADIVLARLTSNYGFLKQHHENLINNNNGDLKEFQDKAKMHLANYADEHSKLPAYNKFHQLCKMGCIHLANLDTNAAISCFTQIKNLASDPVAFAEAASSVFRNSDGKIITYDEMKELEHSHNSESTY